MALDREALLAEVFMAMDKNGNGFVDLHEFKATAKSADEAAQLPSFFAFLDGKETDGKLSLEEWKSGMMAMPVPDEAFEAELRATLATLSEKGAPPATLDRAALLEEAFQAIDVNGNGFIDLPEFVATAKSAEEAAELPNLFKFLDVQQTDGKLSREEWVSGMSAIDVPDATFEEEMRTTLKMLKAGGATPATAPPRMSVPEKQAYCEKHQIEKVLGAMVNDVLDAASPTPIAHMAAYLTKLAASEGKE